MNRDEMILRAAPPCRECDTPVQRVEFSHERNGDGDWVPASAVTVCAEGHRVEVERF